MKLHKCYYDLVLMPCTYFVCSDLSRLLAGFYISCIRLILHLQGYNGSQSWDTAFAAQAIISTNLIEEFGSTLQKAHTYIKNSQVVFFAHVGCFTTQMTFWFLIVVSLTGTYLSASSLLYKGFRRLPWELRFLVSPHLKGCLAYFNSRSRMAHLRLHSRRIKSNFA